MTKTNKKILLTILLIIIAILLYSTNVFAADANKAELFQNFKEEERTDYYTTTNKGAASKYYGLNYYTFANLNASVKIDNTDILKWEKRQYDTSKYFYTQGKEGKANVKVTVKYNGKKVTKNYTVHVYTDYDKCRFEEFKATKYKSTYNLFAGESVYITYAKDLSIKSSNKKVADIMSKDSNTVVAKAKGETKITAKAKYNGKTAKKTFKIKVTKVKDAKLESKDNDVVSIAKDKDGKEQILLANGDLWNTNKNTFEMTKKATTNVKKHVYTAVYDEKKSGTSKYVVPMSNILKNSNKLEVKSSAGNKKIKNVKDVILNYYLTKNGDVYAINAENGKLKVEKKISGVTEMFTTGLVKKDNKLYTTGNIKVSDQNVIQAFGSSYSGIYLNSSKVLYKYRYNYSDNNYMEEVVERNVKTIYNSNMYETNKGTLKYIYSSGTSKYVANGYLQNVSFGLKKNGKLYANDVKVLTNVADIYSEYKNKMAYTFIVKKDGSIWLWTQKTDKDSTFKKIRSGKASEKKISQVSKLKVKKQSKNNAKVTWKKVGGAKKYTVYRATSKKGKYKKIGTSTSGSYTDKKAKKGKTYYYKVVTNAYNGKYSSKKTSAVSVKM